MGFVNEILDTVRTIGIIDVMDIACLSFVLFYVYKFIRDRRAGKLAIGIVFIVAFLIVCELLDMRAMKFIFSSLFQVGIVALVIIFQPELRSALEKMGDSSIKGIKSFGEQKDNTQTVAMINEICDAVFDMAKSKTGAIIVFERNTKLGDLILTGTVINAQVSSFLIRNLFFNKAPLHDGAVIVRDNRLYAAGCLLPLSTADINKDLGTRHRAAIGMSENSDAVVVVVSEETGIVSLANEGQLRRNFTRSSMKKKLEEYLVTGHQQKNRAPKIKIIPGGDDDEQ